MIATAVLQASTNLLVQLANPATRALALAAAAGLALAAFRVKSTSVRLFAWTGVLYAALAMPLLSWTLPPLPIPTPAFGWRSTSSVRDQSLCPWPGFSPRTTRAEFFSKLSSRGAAPECSPP